VTSQHGAVRRLMELGFSQYEAQAYVGLLGRESLAGELSACPPRPARRGRRL
jgi:sugar-specific transcriptional regulator TrmB